MCMCMVVCPCEWTISVAEWLMFASIVNKRCLSKTNMEPSSFHLKLGYIIALLSVLQHVEYTVHGQGRIIYFVFTLRILSQALLLYQSLIISKGGVILSPRGIAHVCKEDQLELTCTTTMNTILDWIIAIPGNVKSLR